MSDSSAGGQAKRSNLGRGLAALFGDEGPAGEGGGDAHGRLVPIEFLHPNPRQPRRYFDETHLEELAESIRESGLLQPILVRRHAERQGEYEIVAGERRWRAAQQAQIHELPVIVRDVSDAQSLELALLENVQRQDLTAIEEAEGYQRLIDEFDHTREDLGRLLGKSRSHIANTLRLLSLPTAVKTSLQDGIISAGHARALIGVDDAEEIVEAVARRGLSVRETERLVQRSRGGAPQKRPRGPSRPKTPGGDKDADTLALERNLSALLGLKVSIELRGEGGSGTLTIHYRTLEQLDDVLHRLNQGPAGGAS